ncbi:MAG: DUF2723 domain-containing protein [Candidatus Latescibacteria bacterium]|nr:DUF2723 domain-containing protein [Candidatus Latescibacterota bacterium]
MKNWAISAAAGAVSLIFYLLTLCPTVYVEGAGELIGAVHLLGTPHPTGYPLLALVGRLFTVLVPVGEIAWRVNLLTAITGALAVGTLAGLLQARGLHWSAALGGALALGLSETFWSQAVIAEVYGLSLLGVGIVIWLGLDAAAGRDPRRLILAAYAMGVGLTTHLSHILLWPGLGLLLFLRWRGSGWGLWGRAGLALAGGYSLALYLPLRQGRGPGFHWSDLGRADLLWDYLSGALYRSSFFSLPPAAMVLNMRRWAEQMAGEFHLLLVPVVLAGIWLAWRRDRPLAVAVGAGMGLNLVTALNYHRDPNGIGVFFLITVFAMAVFFAFALDEVRSRVGPGRIWLGPILVLIPGLLLGWSHYQRSDRSGNDLVYRYADDILAGLPTGAVLISEGDDASFALDYLQRIQHRRPDIELYNRMGRGTDLVQGAQRRESMPRQYRSRARAEAKLIGSGRPVFYLYPRQMPLPGYTFVPTGLCYRVWPEGQEPSGIQGTIDLRRAGEQPFYRDPWVRKIQSNYWFMRGEQLLYAGLVGEAIEAYQEAGTVAYDSRSMRYNVARSLYLNGRLEAAFEHAQAAARLDPWQTAPLKLMARIRRDQGRWAEAEILHKSAVNLRKKP